MTSIKTVEQLEAERQALIDNFWDPTKKQWKAPTQAERKNLQKRIRTIAAEMRFIAEAAQLSDTSTPDDLRARLFPLVSRRNYTYSIRISTGALELVYVYVTRKIFNTPDGEKELLCDGDLFCFEPEVMQELMGEDCNCGAYPEGSKSIDEEAYKFGKHLEVCPNKVEIKMGEAPIHRIKHSRGDWSCKGCLNTSLSANPSAEDQVGNIKWLDWCPNFPENIRALELADIGVGVKAFENICYAGLMHSQLEMGERETEGTKITQHMKIVRMCDTCGHREEEDKTSEWEETPISELPAIAHPEDDEEVKEKPTCCAKHNEMGRDDGGFCLGKYIPPQADATGYSL